jgi:hypothetical protein
MGEALMADRSIAEIVLAVQEQEEVSDEELRLCLLALDYKAQLAQRRIESALEHGSLFRLMHRTKLQAFTDWHTFNNTTPKKYLGPRYTPGTEENTKGRRMSKRIMDAAMSKKGG